MRIHLVHGIHTPTGDPAVERLIPYLTGDVRYADYGWIAAVETRRINPVVVGSILPYIAPEDVMIGHSNGCAIIEDLLQRGVKMAGVVLINGALKQDIVLPPCVGFAHVYFNEGDDITEVARVAEQVFLSPVDPNWGAMGHGGYIGMDSRVENIDCGNIPGMIAVSGHSDIFTPEKIPTWGAYIDKKLWASYEAWLAAQVQAA